MSITTTQQIEPTVQNIVGEIIVIRQSLQNVLEEVQQTQKTLRQLMHVFNECITDLYGEIEHLKIYGSDAGRIPRQRIIMHNYFSQSTFSDISRKN